MPILDPNDLSSQLDPEQIRALFERAIQDETTNNQSIREEEAARDFREAHPEYVANPRNGALLETALQYSGTQINSFEDIEKIYNDLRERGLLELDGNIIAQQEREARQARIAAARNFRTVRRSEATEQDLLDRAWTMDVDQLRDLANQNAFEQEGDSGVAGFDSPRPSRRTRSGI